MFQAGYSATGREIYTVGADRASIIEATKSFLESAEAESNAGSMEDALERVERLRKRAQSFSAVIEERAVGDLTRDYVDETLAMSYAQLNTDHTEREYVVELSADLSRFFDACDLTLQRLKQDDQHNYWPEGGAWEHWIRQLTDILEAQHLPAGARKDAAGYGVDKASPFVKFVGTLQTFLPKKHIRGRYTLSSLAEGIYKAREKPKPAVAPRKSRARRRVVILAAPVSKNPADRSATTTKSFAADYDAGRSLAEPHNQFCRAWLKRPWPFTSAKDRPGPLTPALGVRHVAFSDCVA